MNETAPVPEEIEESEIWGNEYGESVLQVSGVRSSLKEEARLREGVVLEHDSGWVLPLHQSLKRLNA